MSKRMGMGHQAPIQLGSVEEIERLPETFERRLGIPDVLTG